MSRVVGQAQNAYPPVWEILPFVPVQVRLRVFDMPTVRFIGKSTRDRLYSDPSPIPAFWSEYIAQGCHRITDTLPHVIPNTLGCFYDYSSDTSEYTYLICVACPADTPVPEEFEYRDSPATLLCHGATNASGADPYEEESIRLELSQRGLNLIGPLCEFYPDPAEPFFCVLFACRPAGE